MTPRPSINNTKTPLEMLICETSFKITFTDVEAHTIKDGVGYLVLEVEPKMISHPITKSGAGSHAEVRKAHLIGINMSDITTIRVA